MLSCDFADVRAVLQQVGACSSAVLRYLVGQMPVLGLDDVLDGITVKDIQHDQHCLVTSCLALLPCCEAAACPSDVNCVLTLLHDSSNVVCTPQVIIVVEGIYSMEGETTLLPQLVALKRRYKAYLYLDEAHSIGCMGERGRGLCEHAGVDPADVDVLMGTFTKSFGSAGGYIAGSKKLIAYLRQHSPAHLYATSMAPGVAQQIISAILLLQGKDGTNRGAAKIKQLHGNANYFRQRLLDMGLHVLGDWDSPVMPIMVYHLCYISGISRRCLQRHIAMVVVGFPATALLMSRCRVCISASHTREDLDYALEVIYDVCSKMGLQYNAKQLPWPWSWVRLLLWPPQECPVGSSSYCKKGSSSSLWAWFGSLLGFSNARKTAAVVAAAGKAQPLVTAAA
eukprot:GHRR01011243.1.p1 GENE.GHRR01011243.1~~GHRR01011243.1.p1  ORF type:complete len:396 (+),score=119.83 GHRR01011243.1:1020-2207(+)